MVIEEEFMIIDANGSEYTFSEYMNGGINKADKIKSIISLKEEIKNSIHNILKNRGYDIDTCYDLSYDMTEVLNDYFIKAIERGK